MSPVKMLLLERPDLGHYIWKKDEEKSSAPYGVWTLALRNMWYVLYRRATTTDCKQYFFNVGSSKNVTVYDELLIANHCHYAIIQCLSVTCKSDLAAIFSETTTTTSTGCVSPSPWRAKSSAWRSSSRTAASSSPGRFSVQKTLVKYMREGIA